MLKAGTRTELTISQLSTNQIFNKVLGQTYGS